MLLILGTKKKQIKLQYLNCSVRIKRIKFRLQIHISCSFIINTRISHTRLKVTCHNSILKEGFTHSATFLSQYFKYAYTSLSLPIFTKIMSELHLLPVPQSAHQEVYRHFSMPLWIQPNLSLRRLLYCTIKSCYISLLLLQIP